MKGIKNDSGPEHINSKNMNLNIFQVSHIRLVSSMSLLFQMQFSMPSGSISNHLADSFMKASE